MDEFHVLQHKAMASLEDETPSVVDDEDDAYCKCLAFLLKWLRLKERQFLKYRI